MAQKPCRFNKNKGKNPFWMLGFLDVWIPDVWDSTVYINDIYLYGMYIIGWKILCS